MRDHTHSPMRYRSHAPAGPLAGFVESIWLCSGGPAPTPERVLLTGTIELMIHLQDSRILTEDPAWRYGVVCSGAFSESIIIEPREDVSVLGVHFRPGGAFPFLGLPAGELADQQVDLSELWGSAALELRERLCAAASPEERFATVASQLLAPLQERPRRHPAVTHALRSFAEDETARVADLADGVGLSQRRFIELFTAEVGLTPKRYQRICRFQRARALAHRLPEPDWTEVAFACGYYDQSHLIHDFQAFAGLSPGAYLRQRSEPAPDHAPTP